MASAETQYALRSDDALDPGYQLIEPISIDDEDIMWGGKSLSTWYEEERMRLRGYVGEEERRGRQRHRTSHSSSSSQQSSKTDVSKK